MTTDQTPAVHTWEYLIESLPMFSIKVEGVKYGSITEYLNGMGLQGWELIQAPTYLNSNYIFKRQIVKQ